MNILLSLLLQLLTLYLTLTMLLLALSLLTTHPLPSFLYRLLASYLALLLCATYGVLASLALLVLPPHRSAQWATARAFQHTMALLTGITFEILSGQPHLATRPAVFVGNHQTALDVLLLGAIFPRHCSVTAKQSLKRVPFLGWFMALSGTVFIDRADRATALRAFAGAAHEMRDQRQSVFIFPEGTRSNAEEAHLLPFKKGAFHLAIQAGVPIVPVVAGCYWGVLGVRERRFRAGRIPVVVWNPLCSELILILNIVLPPIPTAHLTPADVEDLTRQTRDAMLDALVRLTNSPRGQHAANPALKPLTTPAPPFSSLEEALADGKGKGAGGGTSVRDDGAEQLRRHGHGKET
ncbi:1-acylglycerol-3-phosphate O-acyltransferase [Xylographa soralifera]|nr:1-acylglycerol-3-phosphate O-acyltransferase [Xylographa soralifera]